ncbi:MAG: helix-turn-helix transcriptional regulator [Candidatus Rokubacteria bacterium]|nr:helix-turn-helix transcriptional regulator [Candidatus Rokubacteria bacterium]MBI4628062.1 helix-turn-helix transcriptional regulator [Candidatus Rokubacteria bacterium]
MDELTLALEQAQRQQRLPPPAERRRLRRRAGLSQVIIGRALGVSGVTISRWESGARTPSRCRAPLYADVLERLAREAANGGGAA